MKNIGETIFVTLAVIVLCAVVVINNAPMLASWMAWAQSIVSGPPPTVAAGDGGNWLVQNLIAFAVVSVVGGVILWARKPKAEVDADGNPAEIDYSVPAWVDVRIVE